VSYSELTSHGPAAPGLLAALPGLRWLREGLRDGWYLYGANVGFDVLSSVTGSAVFEGQEQAESLLAAWVDAYEQGRVFDVLLDQKLIDNAAGCLGLEQLPGGRWVKHRYNLAYTSQRLGGPELDKGDDTWRLRYWELLGVPVEQWPEDARSYAMLDAYATAYAVWVQRAQPGATRWQRMAAETFPGKDLFSTSVAQARADLATSAMSGYGLRTDPEQTEQYATQIEREHAEVCESLRESGLVWVEWIRPESGPYSERLEWNRLKRALRKANATPFGWETIMRQIGATPKYHRSTKAAAELMYRWCTEHGLPVVHTDSYSPKPPPKGKGHAPSECISLDKDATRKSGNETLQTYSEVSHLGKVLSADLKWLRHGAKEPIHSNFDILKETNRTGSSKPNVQNRARGKDDAPGQRECFVPRPGWAYIDADYEQGELWTLAQVCHWWLGWTTLGQTLRAGVDPHTKMGCEIYGCDCETGLALRKSKDPAFDDARGAAKVVNFGGPGGIGAKTMTEYGAKGYGVVKPQDEWARLLKLWKGLWLELPDYFGVINSFASEPWPWQLELHEAERHAAELREEVYREPSYYSVALPTGFLRGRTNYPSACNTPYQSTLASVLKVALWRVFRACYVDRTDALYGSRPVNEIHDQLLVETRIDDLPAAREAAASLEHHMNEAAKEVCPDYPTWTQAILAERWSKKAGHCTDDQGNLVVWRDKRIVAHTSAQD
jgi:hypothetical protein